MPSKRRSAKRYPAARQSKDRRAAHAQKEYRCPRRFQGAAATLQPAHDEHSQAADLQTRLKSFAAITTLLQAFDSPAGDRIPAHRSLPAKPRLPPDKRRALRAAVAFLTS